MKIWTLTTNDEAPGTDVFSTKAEAEAQAMEWVKISWESWYGPDLPVFDPDWEIAAEKLYDQAGFMDSITLSEHDISTHPAAVQARGALNNCIDQITILADLAECLDEDTRNALIDAHIALEMLK